MIYLELRNLVLEFFIRIFVPIRNEYHHRIVIENMI